MSSRERDLVARLAWPAAFTAKDQNSAAPRRAVAEAYERADNILAALSEGKSATEGALYFSMNPDGSITPYANKAGVWNQGRKIPAARPASPTGEDR
jgi:hypothetical protein